MGTIAEVAQAMQTVLTEVADRAGRATGFVQRESKLGGAKFAQTLVFGWLANPDATLEELAQSAASVGVTISPQGLDERFTERAAACLKQVLSEAVQQLGDVSGVTGTLLDRFKGVYVLDSTTVSLPKALASVWPGGGDQPQSERPAALKISVCWNIKDGPIQGLQLQAGRDQDQTTELQRLALPADALRLADLGYFDLDVLRQLNDTHVYWVSRWKVRLSLYDATGRVRDLKAWLDAHAEGPIDEPIQLGQARVACRLLAVRVPQAVADRRRQQLHQQARRKGQTVSQARLDLANWTILLTNVPKTLLSLTEALALARLRWQIELLFKLWKSHGQLDQSRSAKPWRILCEVYAKLLAVLVQHWVLLVSCWQYPDRSLVKAAQTVRRFASYLAHVFHSCQLLCQALEAIQACLAHGCRINKRRANPSAPQLLAAASQAALA